MIKRRNQEQDRNLRGPNKKQVETSAMLRISILDWRKQFLLLEMAKSGPCIIFLIILVNIADGSISVEVSKDLTYDGFTFSCVLSPGPINTVVVFENPAGDQIGGCTAPANPTTSGNCDSPTSPASTVTQDLSTHTTTIDIPAGYINGTSGLTGAWKCTHGSDQATVTYSNILAFNTDGLSFKSPQSSEDLDSESVTQVTFNMACLFPSATYNIEYLDSEAGNVVHTQTLASTSCTTTTASCTTDNSNATGQDCSFNVDESKLVSRTAIRVTAMVKGMQTTNYPTILSSFTITKSAGLSGGAIAGIVIGCLVVAGIVVAVVVVVVKKKKGSPKKKPDSGNSGDKKIERSSKVNEKNTKPLSPSTLTLTNEAKPGGRALPPIPQHEKKKKTPRKKKKRVKTEDGEDTEKLPPIQKKERNTRDTQDPES